MMGESSTSEKLNKVYVEVTSECNLHCRTCVRNAWEGPTGRMSLSLFRRLVDQLGAFPGPLTLSFGGYGEPLYHPDFLDMVQLAREAGLRVELTTNGTLLDQETAKGLVELGVSRVWASVDGATQAGYSAVRGDADLEAVLENVRWLFRLRWRTWSREPEIGLVFVAMKSNVGDLPELRRLASSVRATQVLVTNVLPHTADMVNEILYRDAVSMPAFVRSPWVPVIRLPRLNVDAATGEPLYRLLRGGMNVDLAGVNLATGNDTCPFVADGATAVAWDGRVSPCPPLMHTHPEFVIKRWHQVHSCTLGNIATGTLAGIWHSDEYSGFRRKVRAFDFAPCTFCNGCELANSNEADCYGNTFPTCGGCLWAQGIIRCP